MFEFLTHPIPAVVFLLGVLVFIHEFGHFIVGILLGVGVETFSIGYGPRMFGFRKNGTDYRISWLPLGGYVKFAGAMASEEVPERFIGKEMHKAVAWKRFLIVSAGPVANLILAVVVYAVLGSVGIKHPSSVIGQVRPGSPAEAAGLRSADKIISIDGQEIKKWRDLQKIISKAPGESLKITVQRKNEKIEMSMVPQVAEQKDFLGRLQKVGRVGIGYGFAPAYLSLINQNSPAGKSGLLTGDLAKQIEYSDKKISIGSEPDFLDALDQVYKAKVDSFKLKVKRGEDLYTLNISTAVWQSEGKLNEDFGYVRFSQSLSQSLGITDSQLTIEATNPPIDLVLNKKDRLLSFNKVAIKDIYHLQELLENNKKPTALIGIQRGNVHLAKVVELKPIDVQKPAGVEKIFTFPVAFMAVSIEPEPFEEKYNDLFSAIGYGVSTTAKQSTMLVGTIAGLFTGDVPVKALGGPMLIAKVAGDSAKMGWQAFLTSLALISINLGMINLFPIPALDGGHIVMIGAELVKRGPLSEEAIENYQKVGFVMVLALIVLATYNDFSRFWRSMVEGLAGMF